MSTEIILVRHGEVNWRSKKAGSAFGHLGPSLSEKGKKSAKKVALYLGRENDLAVMYTSPLQRARETAAIIAEQIGLQPKVKEDLREWEFPQEYGVFDWIKFMVKNEISKIPSFRHLLWPQLITFYPFLKAFIGKVSNATQEIIASNSDMRVVIVAHGGTFEGLLTYFFQDSNQWKRGVIKNCSVTRFLVLDHEVKLISFNDVAHLV